MQSSSRVVWSKRPEAVVEWHGPVDGTEKGLCWLVSEFGWICEMRKLTVNASIMNVIKCSRSDNASAVMIIQNR